MNSFDEEVIEGSQKIINNFNPKITKTERDGEWVSALIEDSNSNFKAWMDYNTRSKDLDWNKFIFYNNNSKDMIEKKVMDDAYIYEACSSLVYEKFN